jgi:hypothetical protein
MIDETRRDEQAPHPVFFDVQYPETLSRGLIFVKWLLVIPHAIIAYLLSSIVGILAIIGWFAVLFTGRYPRSMHEFSTGALRWQANVFAYVALLRDEYPPFSFDRGIYPLALEIPVPERQSRWRLFFRPFAIIPNYIVFQFVLLAWFFTTFMSWFAILFTGRYPRGLFQFSVGVMRWWARQNAYGSVLRDEYPPYSVRADARPGNEVLSAVIGIPLLIGLVAAYVLFVFLLFAGGTKTVTVDAALLDEPGGIARTMPVADARRIDITLEDFGTATLAGEPGTFSYFDVKVEKEGFGPLFYMPYFFFVDDCGSNQNISVTDVEGVESRWFWGDGTARSRVYFDAAAEDICGLSYFSGLGFIEFEFE